ncbi:hypothetical protein Zm00014a_010262 [Zea mays]|uniref:Transposase n=1 Tax=Zea mays TaxID=4577 RepID=A0A3L6FNX8_MAIZE|nr:hypothetical protein Zm00014a_010261 [Zea mays]PWZ36585.1 hypothetical protein Zm00014a_010262 [Zea mays]
MTFDNAFVMVRKKRERSRRGGVKSYALMTQLVFNKRILLHIH